MPRDAFVKRTSSIGNSILVPAVWEVSDKGDVYSVCQPDGTAVITVYTFTAEGSGSVDKFAETVTAGLLPDGATGWQSLDWSEMMIGKDLARRYDLVPLPEAGEQFRVYVLCIGKYYHAIVVNAWSLSMKVNGEFYEDLVRGFAGVR